MSKMLSIRATTAADGSFNATRRLTGLVHAIGIEKGDLDTPDVTIAAVEPAKELLNVDAVAADTQYRLGEALVGPTGVALDADPTTALGQAVYGPVAVFGQITVAIAGGGAAKTGVIKILYD